MRGPLVGTGFWQLSTNILINYTNKYKILIMNKKIFFILLFSFSSIGCGISGEIIPEWHDHSYQGQFKFTQDSHAIITLRSEETAHDSPIVSTHRIDNIKKFPIPFSIPFPDNTDTKKLRISAKVISGKGDEAIVGDFVTEEVTPVNRWSSTTIKVVGLESCKAPHKGGFCSSTPKKP